ncbi:PREDICTED: B3 domain-containing protein At1g05930-like [Camelina sativa]|uniref:B3 domain-containing protein At1g05930-like n=1 Tax=Camelina sativa TaxID=90675 RepID=A0ABM0X470_CAMSA|nr:PREDICTED: B3 domain-containing protein At1g05930-like [Camelina sativa]
MTTNDAAETKKMWENLHVLADAAAMVYDEEQRERKGKAKIVSEEEDEESKKKSFFDHVPRKIRSALRYSQPNFENLNGASASSSRLVQSSPSSCLTNPTSSMSHAMSQRSRSSSSGFKKSKEVTLFSRTPRWLIQVIRDMNGEDPKLICEKTLIVADVKQKKSRLSIPFNLIRNDFLTAVESRIIEEDINKDEKIGVGALLVDQRTKIWGVILKKCDMKNGSWDYSLVCGWDDVVKANGFKHGDYISLWSFRCRGVLCFALVPPSQ